MTPEQKAKLELYAEADRRGILVGEKKALYDEYMSRQGQSSAAPEYQGDKDSVFTPLLKGATMNFSDEIMGGIGATYAKIHNMLTGSQENQLFPENKAPTFAENYAQARDMERADQKAFAKEHPKANLALELAGGLTTGGLGASKVMGAKALTTLAPKAATLAKMAAGSGIGAVQGGAYGFGGGEGLEESLEQAKSGAKWGAALSPVIGGTARLVGHGLARPIVQKQMNKIGDTVESLTKKAKAYYAAADAAGIVVKAAPFKMFRESVIKTLKAEGVDVLKNPKTPVEIQVSKAVKRMMSNKTPSYKEIEATKTLLEAGKKSSDQTVRSYSHQVSGMIDDFVDGLKPGDITKGNVAALTNSLKHAKSLWHRQAQSKTITDLQRKATRSEVNIMDRDFDAGIRSKVRSVLDSERKSLGLKEIAEPMEKMLMGSRGKNLLRVGGQMAPGSQTARGIGPAIGSMAMAGAVGMGATGGNPLGLLAAMIPPVLGGAFKSIANKVTRRELDALQHLIINNEYPAIKTMVESLVGKYAAGLGANLAGNLGGTGRSGQAADVAATQLEDLIATE